MNDPDSLTDILRNLKAVAQNYLYYLEEGPSSDSTPELKIKAAERVSALIERTENFLKGTQSMTINTNHINATILAYLMRGLDSYARNESLPYFGVENFHDPDFAQGEYEAFFQLAHDIEELDFKNFDLPMSMFLYEFVEHVLAEEVYTNPKTWKNNAKDLLAKVEAAEKFHQENPKYPETIGEIISQYTRERK